MACDDSRDGKENRVIDVTLGFGQLGDHCSAVRNRENQKLKNTAGGYKKLEQGGGCLWVEVVASRRYVCPSIRLSICPLSVFPERVDPSIPTLMS